MESYFFRRTLTTFRFPGAVVLADVLGGWTVVLGVVTLVEVVAAVPKFVCDTLSVVFWLRPSTAPAGWQAFIEKTNKQASSKAHAILFMNRLLSDMPSRVRVPMCARGLVDGKYGA